MDRMLSLSKLVLLLFSVMALSLVTGCSVEAEESESSALLRILVSLPDLSPPNLTLSEPIPGSSVNFGQAVTFSGSAIDKEDGDISSLISWASNLDGELGDGASIVAQDLSIGTHAVSASVTDSDNNTTQESLGVVVAQPAGGIDGTKFHVFGHSLFTYDGGDEAPATPYTRAGVWLGLLAGASNKESVGSFTFGQYGQHNSLNWSSASSVNVTGAYDLGNTSEFSGDFANQNYTHFLSMPSNFLQEDMGGAPFANSVSLTQEEWEELDSNIDQFYPAAEHILYVHWQDAAAYPVSSTNNRADFTSYNTDVIGDYLAWHIRLQDALVNNGRQLRTAPVGPVIAWLLENESYLQSLNFNDLYGDSAPHGSENIYLLAALVVYQVIFESSPQLANFAIPAQATQIRPEIANNIDSISAAIQSRLNFHNANGVRVWND